MGSVATAKMLNDYKNTINPQNQVVINILTEFGKRLSNHRTEITDDEFYNVGLKKFRRGFAGITFALRGAIDPIGGGCGYKRRIEESEAIRRVLKMNLASTPSEAKKILELLVSAPRDITFRVNPPYNIVGVRLEKSENSYTVTYLPIDTS